MVPARTVAGVLQGVVMATGPLSTRGAVVVSLRVNERGSYPAGNTELNKSTIFALCGSPSVASWPSGPNLPLWEHVRAVWKSTSELGCRRWRGTSTLSSRRSYGDSIASMAGAPETFPHRFCDPEDSDEPAGKERTLRDELGL